MNIDRDSVHYTPLGTELNREVHINDPEICSGGLELFNCNVNFSSQWYGPYEEYDPHKNLLFKYPDSMLA